MTERSFHYGKYGLVTAKLVEHIGEGAEGIDFVRCYREALRNWFEEELSPTADLEYAGRRGRRRGNATYVLTVSYSFSDGRKPTLGLTVSLCRGTEKVYETTEEHKFYRYRGELYYAGEKRSRSRGKKMKKLPQNA